MTDEHTEGLLPCPFCGGPASKRRGDVNYGVGCARSISCVGLWRITLAEAITAWNTRSPTPTITAEDEREACAKVADTFANLKRDNPGGIIAAAIRNRPPIAAGGEVERYRAALERIADECEGTAPQGVPVGIASKCHRIARTALSPEGQS